MWMPDGNRWRGMIWYSFPPVLWALLPILPLANPAENLLSNPTQCHRDRLCHAHVRVTLQVTVTVINDQAHGEGYHDLGILCWVLRQEKIGRREGLEEINRHQKLEGKSQEPRASNWGQEPGTGRQEPGNWSQEPEAQKLELAMCRGSPQSSHPI